jgi:hypothetical protein
MSLRDDRADAAFAASKSRPPSSAPRPAVWTRCATLLADLPDRHGACRMVVIVIHLPERRESRLPEVFRPPSVDQRCAKPRTRKPVDGRHPLLCAPPSYHLSIEKDKTRVLAQLRSRR